jgi:hypothetical protein
MNTNRQLSVVVALAFIAGCSSGSNDGNGTGVTDPGSTAAVTPPGAGFSCVPLELSLGEVRTGLTGSNVCLKATATSEYVINGFSTSAVTAANTQVSLTGFGITTGAATASIAAPGAMTTLDGMTPEQSLELAFRNYEKNVLQPRMRGARAAFRNLATRVTVPTTVGALVDLNGSASGCSDPVTRTGRVVAVSNRAIVVADTGNPAGGFTSAEFASVATTFDTLVDPLDRGAFGDPSDIDGNSRVIIFYTRKVNELTPADAEGIVEGFFNPRDLFPTTATAQLEACPGSNVAEMFYMIVPDPNGTINGNVRTKADVQESTIAVTAHEYQHLINASRRLYVNDASDFEEVWLNEGLSHIAEELLFYRTAGLQPRSNIDATTITASQPRVDAFNLHQTGNFGRYLQFLQKPELSSPYAANDSLSNRGAIWSFLRYAADRKAPTDGTIWRDLVNSQTEGMANLSQVLGPDVITWFRDWSISVFTDDKVATAAQYQQPSWNFRSIFPRIGVNTFPLKVRPLSNAATMSATLTGGGSMYATFGVAAGGTAGVSWTGGSSVVFSIARVK